VQLKDILREKRRGNFTKEVLFLHDNAPFHWALATHKKLAYLGFQCLEALPSESKTSRNLKLRFQENTHYIKNSDHAPHTQ
jgi:hypothetical protein